MSGPLVNVAGDWLTALKASDVTMSLRIDAGEILRLDLVSLYFVTKYAGNNVLLTCTIPASEDYEDGYGHPEIKYRLVLEEIK